MEDEKNEVINQTANGYLKGTIGAIIGGAIASIPWILMYSFANLIVGYLSILIAYGAFYGYKIFKGKIGKKSSLIIAVVSLLIVIIATSIICPMILMAKEGITVTFKNLKMIYSYNTGAFVRDFTISVLFAIIGIAAVIKTIEEKLKNSENNEYNGSDENDSTNANEKTSGFKTTLSAILIIAVILTVVGVAILLISKEKEEKFDIPHTNMTLNTTSKMVIYDTREEITGVYGKDIADEYDFIIVDGDVTVLGLVYEMEDEISDASTMAEFLKLYVSQQSLSGMTNVSEISTKTINGKEYSTFSYLYTTKEGMKTYKYRYEEYLTEVDDEIVVLECYVPVENENSTSSKITKTIEKLLK